MKRTHITLGERWQIYTLLRESYLKKEIAIKLWRVPSTISKEIKRNTRNWVYEPAYAQREYERRRSEINKWRSIIKNDVNMQNTIRKYMMKYKRSPDSIVGRGKVPVCTQTIYNYIAQWEIELKKYCTYKKGYKKHWYKETRGRRKEDLLDSSKRNRYLGQKNIYRRFSS